MILLPILDYWLGNDYNFDFLVTNESGDVFYCDVDKTFLYFDYLYHKENLKFIKRNLNNSGYKFAKSQILSNLYNHYS